MDGLIQYLNSNPEYELRKIYNLNLYLFNNLNKKAFYRCISIIAISQGFNTFNIIPNMCIYIIITIMGGFRLSTLCETDRNKSERNINVLKGPEIKRYIHLKLTEKVHVGVGGRCAPFRLKGTRNREEVIHITNTQKKRGKRGERGGKEGFEYLGQEGGNRGKNTLKEGEREKIVFFFTLFFFKNA
mgnify:FL=1